ncbi:restriction endonuclease [Proteobacteria bacterium 005FR1]|nr:restriction endonuclease [Proteobacteria bacterium 005FR1]
MEEVSESKSIPDYQTLMRPLLAQLADGQVKSMDSLREGLVKAFQLTPEQLEERIPSGKTTILRNRAGWARTYLHKAGLLTLPKKAHCQITERGLKALAVCPEYIGNAYLKQFPEFIEFTSPAKGKGGSAEGVDSAESEVATPDEQMELAATKLKQALAAQLLDTIKSNSPWFFEKLVVDLMLAMGYGGARAESGKATKATGDDGIDGTINEDKLGLDTIYLQAKRWENTVHRPEIDKFIGALTRQGAHKGVFITTSNFSEGAFEAAKGLSISIVLIDGHRLAELMIEHNIGVNIKQTFHVKDIDSDYFNED